MPTSTVEDYLKAILQEEQRLPSGQLVTMGQVAAALGLAPGTVTAMVKTLDKRELVHYEPYSGVRLTKDGRQMALDVLRRHRLIELFLVETLGLDWSEVHEEAERLEHAMSEKLIDRIDALLGYPRVDPHGDPIPDGKGRFEQVEVVSLEHCPVGRPLRIARVSDQDEAFLRFVERNGLKPGHHVTLEHRDPSAAAITIRPEGGETVTLGREAAAKLWVESRDATLEPSS
jgi:DtxR family Mn-dependent transcriptional regulator